jgi:DNA polymerase-3 subunit alpha
VNKRQLEALIQAGAFDTLHPCRRGVFEALETLIQLAKEDAAPQLEGSLFSSQLLPRQSLASARPEYAIDQREWDPLERLQREFDVIGFYLSAHPLESYPLQDLGITEAQHIADGPHDFPKLAGIVLSVKERLSKTGQRFAFAQLSDPTGQYEIALFSEVLQQARDKLLPGTAVLVKASRRRVGDEVKLTAQSIDMLDASTSGGVLELTLDGDHALEDLKQILATSAPGAGRIHVRIHAPSLDPSVSKPRSSVLLELPKGYELSLPLRASLQRLQASSRPRFVPSSRDHESRLAESG